MIKKLMLKIYEESGLTPYAQMEAFIYGALWACMIMLAIYPTFYIMVKVAEMVGLR